MKRFYLKFRIALMTFALGLASVFVFNGSLKKSDEFPVNLPKVQSESPVIVFSATRESIGPLGSFCGGREVTNKNRIKKHPRK